MLKVRLTTYGGGLVAEVEIPPFQKLPEVLCWGSRYFAAKLDVDDSGRISQGDPLTYEEVCCFHVIPSLDIPRALQDAKLKGHECEYSRIVHARSTCRDAAELLCQCGERFEVTGKELAAANGIYSQPGCIFAYCPNQHPDRENPCKTSGKCQAPKQAGL